MLLDVANRGAGVLVTSRDPLLGEELLAPSGQTVSLRLGGLSPDDAYELAGRVLSVLGIDRARVPYAELGDLLRALDYHPLAIQLTLPALRQIPITTLLAEFAALLPGFQADAPNGRNASLLASLNYSLRRLSAAQQAVLPCLAPFVVGTLEPDLLEITGMSREQWNDLRGELEQVGLLTQDVILNGMKARFLHFHPVLTPYLRSLPGANDPSLVERYVRYYTGLTTHMLRMDKAQPERVRAIVQLSLPNLIRALDLLLASDDVEVITATADAIITFLEYAGRLRERNALRARVLAAIRDKIAAEAGPLNWSTYWREKSLGEAELEKGDWTAALRRFQTLLFAIKGRPNDDELGPDSLAHAVTLQQLSRALHTGGRVPEAIDRWQAAWSIAELLRTASPADSDLRRLQGSLQCDHGDLLRDQGKYAEAKAAYDEALQIAQAISDLEGKPDEAAEYRRREHEVYAAFPGHRDDLDRRYGAFIANVAAGARGDEQARLKVEPDLRQLEGDAQLALVAAAIRRVWSGERDWPALTRDLNAINALIVLRVLESLRA